MFEQYYYNPMDYNQKPVRGRNGFYDDDPEDWRGCLWNLIYTAIWIGVIASCLFFCTGCTTTKYVTVPEIHEVHHHHTDSVHQTDSVINDRETIVMILDSVAMEQYGIRLQAAERAFLVKVRELEREIQVVRELHTDTVLQRDSIPVPYPVEVIKEVKKPLTWWQQLRLKLGNIMLALIGIAIVYAAIKLYLKFKP